MSLVPPKGTVLGSLEIEEVYFYYEGPRFFAARSASGQRYLAIAVDEDEDSDTYLYVSVSADRFRASVLASSLSARRTRRPRMRACSPSRLFTATAK